MSYSVTVTSTGISVVTVGVQGPPGPDAVIGNIIEVAINGDDDTATRQSLSKPFASPIAAKNVAIAGDTIHVQPGAYTVNDNLSKNGVNWDFAPGAIVTHDGSTGSELISDSSGAMVCKITGSGEFIRDLGSSPADTVHITNANSDVDIIAAKITNNIGIFSGATNAVRHSAGKLRVRVSDKIQGNYGGVWWDGGDGKIQAPEIVATNFALTSNSSDGNSLSITADKVYTTGSGVGNAVSISGDIASRIWLDIKEIRGANANNPAVSIVGNRVYLQSDKISGAGSAISQGGGISWIDVQKCSLDAGTNGGVSVSDGSAEWTIGQVEDLGSTAPAVVNLTATAGNIVDIKIGTVKTVTANGVQFNTSAGMGQFTGIVDTTASATAHPIVVAGNGFEILPGTKLFAHAGVDCVWGGSARTLKADGLIYNTTINANVTLISNIALTGLANRFTFAQTVPQLNGRTGRAYNAFEFIPFDDGASGCGIILTTGTVTNPIEVYRVSTPVNGVANHTWAIQNGSSWVFDIRGANSAFNVSFFTTPFFTVGISSDVVPYVQTTCMVVMLNLPTADPHVVGQLWNSAGTLKISAG